MEWVENTYEIGVRSCMGHESRRLGKACEDRNENDTMDVWCIVEGENGQCRTET